MTIRMNAAPRRRLAGSALAGSSPSPPFPRAMAQWLPPWRVFASPGDIAGRLEAQGYVLIAPLQRRPGVYLADVRAGPAGYQRLVIDDRNGEILERFSSSPRGFGYPPRRFGPEFAGRYDGVPDRPPPGVVQLPPAPDARMTARRKIRQQRTDERAHSERHQPVRLAAGAALTKSKPKSAATARKIPPAKTAPPVVWPPLPPPAPREAAKPEEGPARAHAGAEDRVLLRTTARTPLRRARLRRLKPSRRRRRSSRNPRRKRNPTIDAGPDRQAGRTRFFRRGERQVEGQHRSGGAVRIDEKGRPMGALVSRSIRAGRLTQPARSAP